MTPRFPVPLHRTNSAAINKYGRTDASQQNIRTPHIPALLVPGHTVCIVDR